MKLSLANDRMPAVPLGKGLEYKKSHGKMIKVIILPWLYSRWVNSHCRKVGVTLTGYVQRQGCQPRRLCYFFWCWLVPVSCLIRYEDGNMEYLPRRLVTTSLVEPLSYSSPSLIPSGVTMSLIFCRFSFMRLPPVWIGGVMGYSKLFSSEDRRELVWKGSLLSFDKTRSCGMS